MPCLHLHLCQWCQPDALGTEALCSGVGCRRGFAIEGLGQPGAGGGKVAVTECSAPRAAMSWGQVYKGKAWTACTCPESLRCPRAPSLPPPLAGETAFPCGAGRDARPRHTGEQQKL